MGKASKYASPGGDYPCPNDPDGSTKNVGGNAPARGGNDPFSYLKVSGPEYSYLGHFKQSKFLQEGHNEAVIETGGGMRTPSSIRTRVRGRRYSAATDTTVKKRSGKELYLPERPVLQARLENKASVQSAHSALKAARRGGGDVAAAKSALSAARNTRRAAVSAARLSPESSRSERRARRGV